MSYAVQAKKERRDEQLQETYFSQLKTSHYVRISWRLATIFGANGVASRSFWLHKLYEREREEGGDGEKRSAEREGEERRDGESCQGEGTHTEHISVQCV